MGGEQAGPPPVCVWGGGWGRLGCGGGDCSLGSTLPGDSIVVVIVPNNTLLCTRGRCVPQTHGCQAARQPGRAGPCRATLRPSWDHCCTRATSLPRVPTPGAASCRCVSFGPGWPCSARRTVILQRMLLPQLPPTLCSLLPAAPLPGGK